MSTTFNEPPKEFSASTTGASRYTKQLTALERRAENEHNNTKSWRLIALTVSGIGILATAGLIYAASRIPTPAVHLVEIDSKTGEPLRHEVVGEPIEISDAMVSHVIGRWIQWTRSKSIDPIVLRDHWERAYQFVPVTSKPQIDAYAREIGAFAPAKFGKEAVPSRSSRPPANHRKPFRCVGRKQSLLTAIDKVVSASPPMSRSIF